MPSSFLHRSRRVECGMVARGPRLATRSLCAHLVSLGFSEDKV